MEKRLGAVDRISQLPEDLLQHILSFLPMKQVVQSTTISKRWKEVWNMFPILEFDANFFDKDNWFVFFPEDERHKRGQKKVKLFEVVEQSLLSRRRQMLSIKKYTLNMFLLEPDMASCFDRWIGYAVDCKVEELTLAIEPLNGSRCQKLVGIELDAPNLRALEYTGDVIDFCSSALALSLANLCFDSRNMEISWYAKQIELLSRFNHCSKVVKLQSETGKSLIVPEELRRTLHSPLYNVKKLNLRTDTVYTAPIEELVDSLLWISPHPETILIENALNEYSFEFSYNKPIFERGSLRCCNSFPASCWRHCIKNFKMENNIGIRNKRFRTYNYLQIPDDAEILEKLKGYKDLEP